LAVFSVGPADFLPLFPVSLIMSCGDGEELLQLIDDLSNKII
jgi:hypothetical protein